MIYTRRIRMDRNKFRRQAQVLRNKRRVRAIRKTVTQVKNGVVKSDTPLPKKQATRVQAPKPIATKNQAAKQKIEQKTASARTLRQQQVNRRRRAGCGSCNRKIKNK